MIASPPPRFNPLKIALILVLMSGNGAFAQSGVDTLPDMGSSAANLITPADEARYGEMVMRELRGRELLIDDPLIDGWLQGLGFRIAASSDEPDHGYTFFMMRDRRINAFATLGGLVGMNAGLVLESEREDEVAGVMAHEVAHVTQAHVLRSAEKSQQNQLPIMLAMLGAIAAASQSESSSSGNAIGAAVMSAQALMAQMQINYTRSNESEADRIGIETLARAGYDPLGIADFFGRLQRASRGNQGGWQAPEYLRSHPVTTTRIAEARDRAVLLAKRPPIGAFIRRDEGHLLLPIGLEPERGDAPLAAEYVWARERLRVISAPTARDAVAEYAGLTGAGSRPEVRYGYALALIRNGQAALAARELDALLLQLPKHLWVRLAAAEAAHKAGRPADATQRFEALLAEYPQHRATTLSYAEALIERGTQTSGRRAQAALRPLLAGGSQDLLLQQRFGRASELGGDANRASESYAEASFLSGRAEDALKQLDLLKQRDDVDYVQRARVEARMAEMMPVVLEMRRIGLKPEDEGRRRDES